MILVEKTTKASLAWENYDKFNNPSVAWLITHPQKESHTGN